MNRIYQSPDEIKTLEDVHIFFYHLAFDLDISFHPDDLFEEMVRPNDLGFFTPEKMKLYDSLMDKCWVVCTNANEDIYNLGIEYIRERFLKRDNIN